MINQIMNEQQISGAALIAAMGITGHDGLFDAHFAAALGISGHAGRRASLEAHKYIITTLERHGVDPGDCPNWFAAYNRVIDTFRAAERERRWFLVTLKKAADMISFQHIRRHPFCDNRFDPAADVAFLRSHIDELTKSFIEKGKMKNIEYRARLFVIDRRTEELARMHGTIEAETKKLEALYEEHINALDDLKKSFTVTRPDEIMLRVLDFLGDDDWSIVPVSHMDINKCYIEFELWPHGSHLWMDDSAEILEEARREEKEVARNTRYI